MTSERKVEDAMLQARMNDATVHGDLTRKQRKLKRTRFDPFFAHERKRCGLTFDDIVVRMFMETAFKRVGDLQSSSSGQGDLRQCFCFS